MTLTLLLPAIFAALGYLAKTGYGEWQDYRRRAAERRAQLLRLRSLLVASRSAFETQVSLCSRLRSQLLVRLSSKENSDLGYDELFSANFATLNQAELELHGIIRGITSFALKPLNEKLWLWLDQDVEYRTAKAGHVTSTQLAAKLNQLAGHLILWLAQSEVWMKDPSHAIVFLADERQTGIGFPKGLDAVLRRRLYELRIGSWDSDEASSQVNDTARDSSVNSLRSGTDRS